MSANVTVPVFNFTTLADDVPYNISVAVVSAGGVGPYANIEPNSKLPICWRFIPLGSIAQCPDHVTPCSLWGATSNAMSCHAGFVLYSHSNVRNFTEMKKKLPPTGLGVSHKVLNNQSLPSHPR